MRFVEFKDGVLEIRWTWLPFWLATHPKLRNELEQEVLIGISLGGMTNAAEDMDALHDYVVKRFGEMFPSHPGLTEYLDGLKYVTEPS